MCGSGDVRWRGRRWYDVVHTWLRGTVEWVVHSVFTSRNRAWGDSRRPEVYQYRHERSIYDENASFQTARRFWNCHACSREGAVFDDLQDDARRRLVALEDELQEQVGGPLDPIDRDGV
jgi:hypothetical protein